MLRIMFQYTYSLIYPNIEKQMKDKHLIFPSMVSLLSNQEFSDLVLCCTLQGWTNPNNMFEGKLMNIVNSKLAKKRYTILLFTWVWSCKLHSFLTKQRINQIDFCVKSWLPCHFIKKLLSGQIRTLQYLNNWNLQITSIITWSYWLFL